MSLALPAPRVVLETERILVLNKVGYRHLDRRALARPDSLTRSTRFARSLQHPHWSLNANSSDSHDGYYHQTKQRLLDDRPVGVVLDRHALALHTP